MGDVFYTRNYLHVSHRLITVMTLSPLHLLDLRIFHNQKKYLFTKPPKKTHNRLYKTHLHQSQEIITTKTITRTTHE